MILIEGRETWMENAVAREGSPFHKKPSMHKRIGGYLRSFVISPREQLETGLDAFNALNEQATLRRVTCEQNIQLLDTPDHQEEILRDKAYRIAVALEDTIKQLY